MSKEKEIKIDQVIYDVEIHPFDPFINEDTEVLIVGTFPPSRFAKGSVNLNLDKEDVYWYYGSKDNNFWERIISKNFIKKKEKEEMKKFAKDKCVGFMDLFYKIKRYRGLASDTYITPLEVRSLIDVLRKFKNIEKIFFTSDWVKNIAKKEYLMHNKEFLLSKNKSIEYVEKERFIVEDGEKVREVEIKKLSSPSPNNYTARGEEGEKKWDNFWDYLETKTK